MRRRVFDRADDDDIIIIIAVIVINTVDDNTTAAFLSPCESDQTLVLRLKQKKITATRVTTPCDRTRRGSLRRIRLTGQVARPDYSR